MCSDEISTLSARLHRFDPCCGHFYAEINADGNVRTDRWLTDGQLMDGRTIDGRTDDGRTDNGRTYGQGTLGDGREIIDALGDGRETVITLGDGRAAAWTHWATDARRTAALGDGREPMDALGVRRAIPVCIRTRRTPTDDGFWDQRPRIK